MRPHIPNAGGTGLLTLPIMFLSSYAPLLGILAIRFEAPWLRLGCLIIATASVLSLYGLMRLQHDDEPTGHTLTEVRKAGEGASSYLSSYLLPFVIISNPQPQDLLAYLAFFAVAYVVTTRTGIIQVNPTLYLLRYRAYSIIDENGAQRYLLSKTGQRITENMRVTTSRLTNDVLIFESQQTTNQA